MNAERPDDRPPVERLDEIDAIVAAINGSVRDALARHKRDGNSIAIWRNDRVEWIAPEDIDLDEAS